MHVKFPLFMALLIVGIWVESTSFNSGLYGKYFPIWTKWIISLIDLLELHIFFKDEYVTYFNQHDPDDMGFISLSKFKDVKLTGNLENDGEGGYKHSELRTMFESLPSSHAGMAFKVYDQGMNTRPFVSIKCSPAKLLQGHNLCGFDDLRFSSLNMLYLLSSSKPDLYDLLDINNIEVSQIDITYTVLARNPQEKIAFINHLSQASKGQTKKRGDGFETTCYFGAKNSRIKRLKVYSKLEEMINDSKLMLKKGFKNTSETIKKLTKTKYAINAIRFEATIKKRFLQRKNIPTNLNKLIKYIDINNDFYTKNFFECWKDIFKTLKGQEVKIMNDTNVYNQLYKTYSKIMKSGNISTAKVDRLNNFYITLKSSGFYIEKERAKDNGSSSYRTFRNNVNCLVEAGFSLSVLQNLHSETGATVLPFIHYFNIDFSNQYFDGYIKPEPLFEQKVS